MAKPEVPPHIARTNARGLIEIIDLETGRILCVQHSPEDLLQGKWERLTKIDTPEGPVWIEKGISFDIINHIKAEPFSQLLTDLVCEKIVNDGATLVAACRELNLKYSTVCRWRRENQEFREKLDTAKKDRAEFLHDEILTRARHRGTSARSHIEALQWAAERGDPEKYSPKNQLLAGAGGVVGFVISTGINREVLPEPRDVTEAVVSTTVVNDDDTVEPGDL